MENNIYQLIAEIQNHISIINDELGNLEVSVAVLKSQMADMIWYLRAIISAFIVLIISQFWQVSIFKKNEKK